MSIKKEFLKTKPVCKVTFTIPGKEAHSVDCAHLVGEFNEWDTASHPMKKSKNGSHAVSLNLETGKEYQFKYFINGHRWENDNKADKYVDNCFGNSQNSVIIL
ncbi:MAG: isoamylase early set domain-containing protein [Bacteroidota bacterium]|nr:isoamylase early set domain-containing protein [Bacteroidota bacterium]